MNINETLRTWIEAQKAGYDSLEDFEVIATGDDDDIEPPCIAVSTTGSAERVDSGVVMRGVSDFSVNIRLMTLPVDEEDGGTTNENDQQAALDIYSILADVDAIESMSQLEGWRIFDIRGEGFNTEAQDGKRVTIFPLLVTACPI